MDPNEQVPDIEDLAGPVLDLYGAHDDDGDESLPADEGPDTRYSRQPLFPITAEGYEAMQAATARDSDRYLHAGLVPIECRHCGTTVQVRKLGPAYTAVQWNSAAIHQCAHFAELREQGRDSNRTRSCPNLTASIKHAVAEGLLEETANPD